MPLADERELFNVIAEYFPQLKDFAIVDISFHMSWESEMGPVISVKFVPEKEAAEKLAAQLSQDYYLVKKNDLRQLMDEAERSDD